MERLETFTMLAVAFVMFALSGVCAAAAVEPWTLKINPGTVAGLAVALFGAGFCFLTIYATDKIRQK
jgi:hypothetical protein